MDGQTGVEFEIVFKIWAHTHKYIILSIGFSRLIVIYLVFLIVSLIIEIFTILIRSTHYQAKILFQDFISYCATSFFKDSDESNDTTVSINEDLHKYTGQNKVVKMYVTEFILSYCDSWIPIKIKLKH